MTGAVLDRPGSLFADAAEHTGGGERPGGAEHAVARGRVTLEGLLTATLQAARTSRAAECPLCHARMTCTRVGAECRGCGSRLS
jgi:hypothetical protein